MKKEVVNERFGFTYEIEVNIPKEDFDRLIKEYEGKKLSQFIRKMPCESDAFIIPYLFNNGQVLVAYPSNGIIYSNLKGYLADISLNEKHLLTTYPRKRIAYLPNAKKVYYFQINPAEGERITLLHDLYNEASDLSHIPHASNLYKTDIDEITEHRTIHEDYNVYFEEDYKALDAKRAIVTQIALDRRRMGREPDYGFIDINMCGRNPYSEQFPDHVDELAAQLPQLLHFPESIMAYSLYSLPHIDKYLHRSLFTDEFADKVFLPLLAYIGKSYIKRNGGEWVMRYDKTFTSWTPDVRDEKGFKDMYRPLLKMLDSTEGYLTTLTSVYHHRPRR